MPLHEVVREVSPHAGVAYVDWDEDVAGLARYEYLTERRLPGVAVARADLRDPEAVLADAEVQRVIFPGRRTCVVMAMVLHFTEPGLAAGVTAGYMRLLAPGSWLVATVGRNDDEARWEQVSAEWKARTGAPVFNYTRDEFTGLFAGLDPVFSPGPAGPHGDLYALGGVARTPSS